MELPSSFALMAVGLLVLANAFFVATEFAIVAVRRSRLEQLAAEGRASPKDLTPETGEFVAVADVRDERGHRDQAIQ